MKSQAVLSRTSSLTSCLARRNILHMKALVDEEGQWQDILL
jgi:hypothetical protein